MMIIQPLFLCPFFFFFFYFPIYSSLADAADSISGNQTLSGDQTIVSSGENFVLGFFHPGNSSRYYIGIWYKKVEKPTIVWVANRETPVLDKNSSHLRILDGNLVLLNEAGSQVWSTSLSSTSNTSTSSSSVVAVLLDNGNLVLRRRDDVGSKSNSSFLWESFNNIADTWLPGGKLAYDKTRNKSQLLISWKNSQDPAPGLYSLELDPVQRQYIIRWNRSEEYWSSGPWNGQIFSGVPEMRLNYIYDFSYINDTEESYFTYSLYNPSIISRFVMDISGQIRQTSWTNSDWNLFWSQPRQQCEVYSYCGAFGSCNQNMPFCKCLPGFRPNSPNDWDLNDFSGGCAREMALDCNYANGSSSSKDKFLMRSYVSHPVIGQQSLPVADSAECQLSCLNNCSCTAYAYDGNGNGNACFVWHGELINLQQYNEGDSNGKTIYLRLSASSPEFAAAGKDDHKGLMIGSILGAVVAILVVAAILMAVFWRRTRKPTIGSLKGAEGSLLAFGYKDLQNVTKNFSDKLGGGGFGSVFKGTLPDSTIIAVKKLESISQGEKQFRTEVSTIGTIQHVNLVRLRGFCSEGNNKLLVYDYMENGSLDSHLFNSSNESCSNSKKKVLGWKSRYNIALGVARGLVYLHDKCRDCIIHCDIKPENILLDAELCPKVADFGLAKLVGRDFSRVLTTMRGTRGYLAPEWISGVAITAKADVYSYGMMVFELVSGRRNSEGSEDGRMKFFPSQAARVMRDGGDVVGLVDRRMTENMEMEMEIAEEEVGKMLRVACWCIQDDESSRPSMSQVVQILEGLVGVNVPPIPRALQVFIQSADEEEEEEEAETKNKEHPIVFFTDSSNSTSSS
ncbi:G-type lectin S-receptor-like serine/threonine-protein kinase At2g19130 [Andrographis paniculata]|uniref:G-type lectin S-receptor-like serine/threonine-protein kinase At2g19130 n=1 Tax=Andrographis paniculata TaxID=175694 RepID=UPI0021E719CF|nr:G-type lectin S-receptor-like serine/threonine-protein kinase At2g19130 [Andrographis paniculata]